MTDESVWSTGGMVMTEENRNTRRETCPSATFPITDVKRTVWDRTSASLVKSLRQDWPARLAWGTALQEETEARDIH